MTISLTPEQVRSVRKNAIPQNRRQQGNPVTLALRTQADGDVFFKGNSKEAPAETGLFARLSQLGGADSESKDKVAFKVSKHFSPTGRDQNYTYGALLDDSRRMATGYKKEGLAGKRIAVAETNSLQLLSIYYGALGTGATVVPLNLLALQDEGTKSRVLSHMIAGPKSDAFVIGADPLFKDMVGLQKILKLKNTPLIKNTAQRYVNDEAPKNPLDKLLFKKLNSEMDRKLAVALSKLEEKGVTPTEKDKRDLSAKIRKDFKTIYEALPSQLKIITPQAKNRLVRNKPLAEKELVLKPDAGALAEIIFTSGTSGNPKGVGITHGNMEFTTQSVSKALNKLIRPDDTILLGLPLFHIFGKAVMLTGMNKEASMVMLPSLSAALKDDESIRKVMKTIQDNNVTVLPSVPIVLEKLVAYAQKHPEAKEAFKNMRMVLSGGSALKKSTYDALKALNPNLLIAEGYGSSEGGINTLNMTGVPGYVGSPLPGVDVRLVNKQAAPKAEEGAEEQEPDLGEVLVKSPGVASSYVYGTVPAGKSTKIADKNGFYHTGDQARRNFFSDRHPLPVPQILDDEIYRETLQILGRESNFIKDAGGERRAPEEFESAVRQADDRINDAMAIAYKPNRETEKSVVVAVTSDPTVNETDLKRKLSIQVATGRLPGALVPKNIIVLNRDSLPEAFKNEFKREAGYKAAKSFVEQAISRQLIQLKDKSATERERTVISDNKALQRFADEYQYTG